MASGASIVLDVNLTEGGLAIKGFDISLNFTNGAAGISYAGSSYSGTGCPKVAGCLFDGLTVSKNINSTGSGGSSYRLSIVDTDVSTPFVNGNGILFRITFTTGSGSVASKVHFHSSSIVENPAPVPYDQIDGYIDTKAAPTANFNTAINPVTLTLIRPVLASQTGTGTVSVTLSSFVGTPGTVTMVDLAAPLTGTTFVFSPATCTAACTPTLTITIHGGPQGGATTTPSGTYAVPIAGNSSNTVGVLMKVAWLKLIIKPPATPVYTVTASRTSFNVELGNWTKINLSAALTSGANDSLSFQSDCPTQLTGGDCVFNPSSGKFPFSGVVNITTQDTTTPVGLHYVHLIPTTTGTYSESPVTMPTEAAIANGPTLDSVLTSDPKIKFVKSGTNTTWVLGETAIYDYDGNSTYNPNPRLTVDSHIKFLNSTLTDLTWAAGKSVVYDANNNGIFDAGDTIIFMLLKTDTKIKFVDTNNNGVWNAGETVVYDSNNNGVYDAGEPVIAGTAPTAGTTVKLDLKVRYADANNNNHWDTREPVVYDTNGIGKFAPGDAIIATGALPAKVDAKLKFIDLAPFNGLWNAGETVAYDANTSNIFDTGDTIIAGGVDSLISGPTVAAGAALTSDPVMKFVDKNGNGVWDVGEPVGYDSNSNGIYDIGLTISVNVVKTHDLAASSVSVSRTFGYSGVSLPSANQLQINVTVSNFGTGSETFIVNATGKVVLKNDPKITFFDVNGNGVWNSGETIIYDTDSSSTYTAGDVLIVGTAPPIGTFLSTDTNLRFVDSNYQNVWKAGETIAYDTSLNGLYDTGEPVPFGTVPSGGVLLKTQSATLAAGATQIVILRWDPGNSTAPSIVPKGNYAVIGWAVPVTGEFILSNNVATYPLTFIQRFKGDVSGDCKVDIVDLATVGSTFGKVIGQAGYNPAADLNNDGVINIVDLVLVAGTFGQSC